MKTHSLTKQGKEEKRVDSPVSCLSKDSIYSVSVNSSESEEEIPETINHFQKAGQFFLQAYISIAAFVYLKQWIPPHTFSENGALARLGVGLEFAAPALIYKLYRGCDYLFNTEKKDKDLRQTLKTNFLETSLTLTISAVGSLLQPYLSPVQVELPLPFSFTAGTIGCSTTLMCCCIPHRAHFLSVEEEPKLSFKQRFGKCITKTWQAINTSQFFPMNLMRRFSPLLMGGTIVAQEALAHVVTHVKPCTREKKSSLGWKMLFLALGTAVSYGVATALKESGKVQSDAEWQWDVGALLTLLIGTEVREAVERRIAARQVNQFFHREGINTAIDDRRLVTNDQLSHSPV